MASVRKIAAAALALFFSLQAFSPLCATFKRMNSPQLVHSPGGPSIHEARLGIAWLHLVFADDEPGPEPAVPALQVKDAQQDDEFIIVRRKKAVLRSKISLKPSLFVHERSSTDADPAGVLLLDGIGNLNAGLTTTDGFFSLKSGLSPPVLLS